PDHRDTLALTPLFVSGSLVPRDDRGRRGVLHRVRTELGLLYRPCFVGHGARQDATGMPRPLSSARYPSMMWSLRSSMLTSRPGAYSMPCTVAKVAPAPPPYRKATWRSGPL